MTKGRRKSDGGGLQLLLLLVVAVTGVLVWLVGAWLKLFARQGTNGKIAQGALTVLLFVILYFIVRPPPPTRVDSGFPAVAVATVTKKRVVATRTAMLTATRTRAMTATREPSKEIVRQPAATPTPSNTPTATATPSSTPVPIVRVVVHSVGLRTGAGSRNDLLAYLLEGEEMELLQINAAGDWYQVRLNDDTVGWVTAEGIAVIRAGSIANGNALFSNTAVGDDPSVTLEATGSAIVTPRATTTTRMPPTRQPQPTAQPRTCCKYCRTGKPCGDSCISRSYTCHVGVGCACYGSLVDPVSLTEIIGAAYDLLTPLPDSWICQPG